MTSILGGLDTVRLALAAQQFALSITQRNVANANNPGYTRQQAVFTPIGEMTESGICGVYIQAGRDRFLDYSISKDLQSLGEYSVAYGALQQIDAILGGSSGPGLQQAFSNFFKSFNDLTSKPEDLVLRQQVLRSATALASEFHRLSGSIKQVQASQDRAVTYTVNDINSITAKIADLNAKIPIAQQTHSESEFTLRDNRQQLVEQLSSLVDISYYETESGAITVTTRQGGALVIENQSNALELTRSSADGFQSVQLDGADITASLESGQLGGLLNVRDNVLNGYLNTLDDMAATVIARVNEQHAQGIDLNGAAGEDFFAPFTQAVPGSNRGAAMSMSVALTNPELIAAAGAGGPAVDNRNAQLLAAIGDEKLFSSSSETISEYYAHFIYQVGSDEQAAEESVTTQNDLLGQLKNQRDASFGVNMDEEAINIIKYQKAYQASAKYATILDSLSEEIINLLGA